MKKLPVARPDEDDGAAPDAERRLAAVVRGVLGALGRPPDFLRATARAVTADDCRVNVLVGADAGSARIAHSYFVTADADGTVTASTPTIRKQY
ncbi:MAG: hypothetical protein K2X87_11895 [Gemmataceae bacterium]|nr:hypothetical protein [Gemmataceae bacterium]